MRIDRDFAPGDFRDRLSERSYLFTMSDIARPHQILLDSMCERGIVFPTDKRFCGRDPNREHDLQCRLKAADLSACRRTDNPGWWSQTGSNRRPPACKAGALPTELWPRFQRSDIGCLRSEWLSHPLTSDICHLLGGPGKT